MIFLDSIIIFFDKNESAPFVIEKSLATVEFRILNFHILSGEISL